MIGPFEGKQHKVKLLPILHGPSHFDMEAGDTMFPVWIPWGNLGRSISAETYFNLKLMLLNP